MRPAAPQTLVAALADHAALTPQQPAVRDDDRALTYGELDRVTNRLASEIVRQCGPAPDPIGVLLDPCVDAVVALYGVMKAGKIALPLDNASPRSALAEVLRHAGAALVVTDENGRRLLGTAADSLMLGPVLDSTADDPAPGRAVDRDDPAVIFYTSGSTGRPKGFVVTHGSQLQGVRSWCRAYELLPTDRLALLFHHSFGASRVSLYGALATGAEVRVYDARRAVVPALARALADDCVTFAHCGASLLRSLLTQLPEGPNFPRLRLLAVGAEGLHQRDIRRFRRRVWPGCALAYTYAVSEAGPVTALFVDSATELDDGLLPVGAPLPGKRVTIAEPNPDGIGEILVAGEGLASGYWRDEIQTANRFVVGQDGTGALIFRTGDRGRLRPDGMLEYHGRLGTQVKVRGYTVDVAEVERALLAVAAFEEVAVVLDESGRPRLVAYVTPEPSQPRPDPVRLRALLADRLPAYMIPAAFVVLDALPRTNRGKVDTAALPPVASVRPITGTQFVAPRDRLERAVADAWEQVLAVSPIGIHDDFAELGGDSLAAVESVGLLQDTLDREVPLAAFLETTTVAGLADLLRRGGDKHLISPLVPLRTEGSRPSFFCVHGGGGTVFPFRALADRLSPHQPFYALQLVGASARRELCRVERLATHYVEQVRRAQPRGPYLLGGYSFGGAVAFEMARQLAASGDPPALVVLIDTTAPDVTRGRLRRRPLRRVATRLLLEARWLAWRAGWFRWRLGQRLFRNAGGPEWYWTTRLARRAMRRYHPRAYDGPVLLLRATAEARKTDLGWDALVTGELHVADIPGGHLSLLEPPHIDAVAEHLDTALARASRDAQEPLVPRVG